MLADLGFIVGLLALLLVAAGFLRATLTGLRRTSNELPLWPQASRSACSRCRTSSTSRCGCPASPCPPSPSQASRSSGRGPPPKTAAAGSTPAWRWPLWACLIPLARLIVTAVPAYRDRPRPGRPSASTAALDSDPTTFDRGQLAQAHPHDYLALDFAAALAAATDQRPEAKRWLERALALAPNDGPTLEAAARQALRDKDEARALTLIDRLDPDATGHARAIALVLDAPWAKALHAGFFSRSAERAIAASRELAARNQPEPAEGLLVWALVRFPRLPRALLRARLAPLERPADARQARHELPHHGGQRPTTAAAWERLGYL